MIPINQYLQESHLQRHQNGSAFSPYQSRPLWIPTTVSFPVSPSVVANQVPQSLEQTTVDELAAASVLVSLAPKGNSRRSTPSPEPALITSSKILETYTPGHVTDSSTADASSSQSLAEESSMESVMRHEDMTWYPGCISLSLPEDDDVLSPLHCFMRRYCVEAFTASNRDIATPRYGKSHGVKVVEGQVGIRCLYCKDRPSGSRPERAVCYPSSLKNIYHSIETWQRRHSLVCADIPEWIRKSMMDLMESSKTRAGGRRQYWEDSATRLGMVDTDAGVRFCRSPGVLEDKPASPTNTGSQKVVVEEDKEMVTDYLFLLLDQMETCQFTEEDRTGGRSKIKNNCVGFPGMQCKHCKGKAGFGRYFPTSVSALALANSDRNINNHIQKCRRCPTQIKNELVRLSKDQSQGKNRRGLRKLFFRKVWERIHGPNAEFSVV